MKRLPGSRPRSPEAMNIHLFRGPEGTHLQGVHEQRGMFLSISISTMPEEGLRVVPQPLHSLLIRGLRHSSPCLQNKTDKQKR